jgi:transposase InsO family protein
VAQLLRSTAGWAVNDKRVERIWRREGLKVPEKQPKRGRLWLADGSCVRLRAERPNHVWSYDFVEDRTHDGRKYRMLNLIDEFTHECLAIRVARKLKATDVIDVLSDLFILRGVPGHVRSDNGPEFVAEAVQAWVTAVGARTAYIAPGSPWENGLVESFNARLRDELLDGEIFYGLREAQVVIEGWRRHYNRCARTPRSATGRRHRRCSCRPSPHGRLRYPGQPHQPPRSWPHDRSCTNIQPGPPSGGRPRPRRGQQAGLRGPPGPRRHAERHRAPVGRCRGQPHRR